MYIDLVVADLPATASHGEVHVADDGSWGRGALPETKVEPGDPTHATTLLRVPFVVLSTALQRKRFTIPVVHVFVLRRGGGDIVVCTAPHEIDVDQPTANDPHPQVRPNPPSVPQVTRNEALQSIVSWSLVAMVAGMALAASLIWWHRRPKPVPPPPPPTPPWTIALREIADARDAFEGGRIEPKPYYDRLSDAVRAFLGRIHGFDGLDMTTEETLERMRRVPSPLVPMQAIVDFLEECDLVKFAEVRPEPEQATEIAKTAQHIVRTSSPASGYYLAPPQSPTGHPSAGQDRAGGNP